MKKLLLLLELAASFTVAAQVPNDECSNAAIINVNEDVICSSTVSGTLTGATYTQAVTDCDGGGFNDVWYQFVALNTSHNLTITVPSGQVAVDYALYSGSCNALTNLQCNSGTTLDNLVPGQSYFIRIFSYNNIANNFTICINSFPPVISISTNYTAEQLVNDILINSDCLSISNISSSTGTNFGSVNGIGYFDKNGSTFTADAGIVLSTGDINYMPGPAVGLNSGSNAWPGDTDLQAFMSSTGLPGSYHNASSLEFDFVPTIDHISFDFIFAANEYGPFQCNFSDAFAFLLTDTSTGNTTNLAVLPNTTVPVSVTTIRNNLYNQTCSSANPQYFDQFFGGSNGILAPINMMGMTVPLTAQSPVIPGHTYHIKLVIADYMDMVYDSAVFIDAGSFNIGAPEYAELTLSGGSVLCEGETTTLSVNLNEAFTFSWSKDGILIPNETTNALVVSEPGYYTVNVTIPTGCTLQYSTIILSGGTTVEGELADYIVMEPNSDGYSVFDLESRTDIILADLNTEDYIVTYYVSEADAEAGVNPLPLAYMNILNPQTIYVKISSAQGNCFTIKTLRLVTLDENFTAPAPTGNPVQEFAPGATLADIVVEGENIQWYDNPGGAGRSGATTNDSDNPLPLSTPLVDGMTYYASQTLYGFESVERLAVTVHITMATAKNTFQNFVCYPNPVKDIITLSNGSNPIDEIEIFNLLGQQVMYKAIDSESATLDLSDLMEGIYILNIKSGEEKMDIKIIKE